MINVALLSKWHVHAEGYAHQASKIPNLSIKVVWDEDPERGSEWAQKLGVPFEQDLDTVLSNPEIDAVIVDTPTNLHKEVIIQAAKYKKHIFSEKVLAFSVEDCEEIFSAIESAGVHFMLSLPQLTSSKYLYAQDVLERGLLGKLTRIRCRDAHNGAVPFEGHPHGWLPSHFFDKAQTGGGALIDLGAHPIYLTNRLAGPAKSLSACLQSTYGTEVEDNAVVLVEYESGAIGTIETGFVSNGGPFQLELYGTEGTLLIENNDIRINSRNLDQDGWVVPENVPAALPMPMEQWVNAIEKGVAPSITREDARNLTLINQAAALSQETGERVLLNKLQPQA